MLASLGHTPAPDSKSGDRWRCRVHPRRSDLCRFHRCGVAHQASLRSLWSRLLGVLNQLAAEFSFSTPSAPPLTYSFKHTRSYSVNLRCTYFSVRNEYPSGSAAFSGRTTSDSTGIRSSMPSEYLSTIVNVSAEPRRSSDVSRLPFVETNILGAS